MSAEYEVGYMKPPKNSQFKAGQSGNPKGRHKGSKNTKEMLDEVLKEKVVLNENGKTSKVTKRQAIIARLVNKAMSGDIKAINTVFSYLQKQDDLAEARTEVAKRSNPADQEVLQAFIERMGEARDGK